MRKAMIGKGILTLVLLLILVAPVIFGSDMYIDETERLALVETREYNGVNLSSINDFKENSLIGPQEVDVESYTLRITGLVTNSKNYTYDEVVNEHQHYKKVVTMDCVEGWSVTILWEGVLVKDLLAEVGPLENATVLRFRAYDGYSTYLPIDYIVDNDIMMAYKMNDVILPPERGFPFQLVAENEWGLKWIKWITEIEVSDDAN